MKLPHTNQTKENKSMKTIKELADLGVAAAFANNKYYHYMSVSKQSYSWESDEPARQAFAQAVRDAVLAELVTKPDSSPTFEAHGFTWFKHRGGDPMPCDGEVIVEWILKSELDGSEHFKPNWFSKARNLGSWNHVAGWRYAEPTPLVTKNVPLDVNDIRATDEFRVIGCKTVYVANQWDADLISLGDGSVRYIQLAGDCERRQHGSNEWKPCTKEVTI